MNSLKYSETTLDKVVFFAKTNLELKMTVWIPSSLKATGVYTQNFRSIGPVLVGKGVIDFFVFVK